MGNDSALLGKTLDVVGLTAEKRLGNQQGEIGVLHTSCLEHIIEPALHLFPDGIAIGLDDHTSAHCRLLGEVGFHHQFIIPLRVIIGSLS